MMNAKNISVISDLDCTGCGACFNSCPVNAIRMDWDREGFLSPVINEKLCISCGKCLSACPIKNPVFDNSAEPKCYAAMAADEIRAVSSSGGLFTLFANRILSLKGIICGAAYRDDFLVEHVIIDKYDDLHRLRGSKYLQSDTVNVFSQLKTALDEGRHALFCGCPCHVAGLNSFLKKRYENLLTIDLMCHGGPSPRLFIKYLRETYPGKEIESFSFRDKSVFGWSTEANIYFKDGTSRHVPRTQDLFYQAFLPCLSVRKSCGICKFATLPRQGDITLADFWGARNYDPRFDDGKGTSILIINSEQGAKFHDLVKDELKLNAEFPLDYVKTHGQPLARPFMNNPDRKRFFEIIENNSFAKAVNYIKHRKFDVGIIGVWPGLNYGSVLTYYALQKSLRNMGLSPLMIDKPGASGGDQEMRESHSRRFARQHFEISKSYSLRDLGILNRHCDSFIIGSDQVWNYGISKNFGKAFYLDFVRDDKKRIAYASSFGHKVDFAPPAQRAAISCLMQKFDAISVREDDGVEICRDIYHVKATQVLDPVFLLETEHYARLAYESQRKYPREYLLAYLLDATEEKKKLLLAIAGHLRLEPLILLDGFNHNAEKNRKFLDMDKNIFANPEVVDWLGCFKNAAYVLTDSFHGMSFSILFKKQFLAVMNKGRGFSRFQSLGRLLDLNERLVGNPLEAIKNRLYERYIDYAQVDQRLNKKKELSLNWLHEAMFKPKVVENLRAYPLIEKNACSFINESQAAHDAEPVKADLAETSSLIDMINARIKGIKTMALKYFSTVK